MVPSSLASLRWRLMLPPFSALVGLLVVALVTFGSLATLREAAERDQYARDVLRASHDLEATFLMLVGELRGYVLTGDIALRHSFEATRQELDRDYSELRALVAGRPAQVERLTRLRALIDSWLSEVATPTFAAPVADRAAVDPIERSQELIAAIRAAREEFNRAEDALLAERHVAAQSAAQGTTVAIGAAILVVAMLVAAMGTLAARALLGPLARLAQAARRLGQGDLTARTGVNSHDELGEVGRAFDEMAARLADERAALVEANTHLESLLEDAPDPMVIIRDDGRIVLVNRAAERESGYTRDDLVGEPVELLVPERLRAGPQQLRDGYLAAPRTRPMGLGLDLCMLRRDGTEVPVEISLSPLRLGDERLVITTIRDVSERRRIEAALRSREADLRLLFQSNPYPLWVFDRETLRFLDANDAALATYGYPRDEFLRLRITDVHAPGDVARLLEELRDEARLAQTNRPWRHRLRDGTLIDVEVTAHPLEFAGRPAVLQVAQDVTERQRAVAALRERREELERRVAEEAGALAVSRQELQAEIVQRQQLEEQLRQAQKMEAIGRLAGGVAHDFNNLLTVIISSSGLLQESLPEDSPLRRYADFIAEAGDRAGALTHQLLAFSRQQVLAPEVLDLNDVVADTEKLLRRLIGEDVNVVTHLSGALDPVLADRGQISQVLLNLAVNARDAMPHGGTLTIETANVFQAEPMIHPLGTIPPGHHVLLAVSDTGTGMDMATQARVFDPFFTTKEVGKGTGLGLSIVYGIVAQSGGRIAVYSEVGLGTTFRIYLPRVDEAAVVASTLPAAEQLEGRETVLVVEDDERVRDLILETLRAHGYTVLVAANGEEAVALARQHDGQIDLVLTDVIMPGMNGREVAQRLSAFYPNARVLYMSGYTQQIVARSGVLAPDETLLQKPFTPGMLARGVRRLLNAPASAPDSTPR